MTRSKKWLTQFAIPLWLEQGVDWNKGGFTESLSLEGKAQPSARRAMVQARQIFSFRTAIDLEICSLNKAKLAIANGANSLLDHYSLASGAFIHAIDVDGIANPATDLYSQAFVLFGLANAYAISPKAEYRDRAAALVEYLYRERRVSAGGFTELEKDLIVYQSNPHMHLFEAAIYWMEADSDPKWRHLADEVLELALSKLIDKPSGLLAEYFSETWQPKIENGKFVFEPGHQFEWCWLMGRYQKLTNKDLSETRLKLFSNGDKVGLCPTRKTVLDQVWSDFTPKSRNSRFWPQCERIKAAAQLSLEFSGEYRKFASESMDALFKFLEIPIQGLWHDSWEDSGEFKGSSVKASSLYHIIGAMAEFETMVR
jgi:mannose-6-phosphate isomerase